MSLIEILIQMCIIFGVVMVGYLATRIGVWKTEMNRPISVFVLNVTCPLLIIGSVICCQQVGLILTEKVFFIVQYSGN